MPRPDNVGKSGEEAEPSLTPSAGARPERVSQAEYAEAVRQMLEGKTSAAPAPSTEEVRQRRQRRRSALLTVTLLALAATGAWSVYDYIRPVQPPPAESQRRAGSIMLFHAVQIIEDERQQTGALPRDLAALNLPRGNYQHVLADTGYTLRLSLPAVSLEYRSGEELRSLLRDAAIR